MKDYREYMINYYAKESRTTEKLLLMDSLNWKVTDKQIPLGALCDLVIIGMPIVQCKNKKDCKLCAGTTYAAIPLKEVL